MLSKDCTDCMLDLLSRGHFARVIACDPHQNIYQFNNVDGRYLVKMQVNYRMSLPQSFRFGNDIAQLLTRIARTSPAPADPAFQVRGMPELQTSLEVVEDPSRAIQKLLAENKKMTVLARKNSSLFFEAMNVIASLGENKSISFIGGFESFSENHLVPVMDLFYLGQGCRDQIQSKFRNYLTKFQSLESLRSKCEREQDMEWLPKFTIYDTLRGQMMGPEKLEALIGDIEDQVIPSQQADVVFSTVHQAKGLGFQNVVLLEDYLDEATQEEYNIFYVACSRVSTGSLLVAKSSMQALDLGPRGRKRGRDPQDFFDYLDFLDDDLFPDDFLESFPEENLPEDFPEYPEDFPETFEHYTLEEEEDSQEGEEEEQCCEDDCFDDWGIHVFQSSSQPQLQQFQCFLVFFLYGVPWVCHVSQDEKASSGVLLSQRAIFWRMRLAPFEGTLQQFGHVESWCHSLQDTRKCCPWSSWCWGVSKHVVPWKASDLYRLVANSGARRRGNSGKPVKKMDRRGTWLPMCSITWSVEPFWAIIWAFFGITYDNILVQTCHPHA